MNTTPAPTIRQPSQEEVEAAQAREQEAKTQADMQYLHDRVMFLSIELARAAAERDELRGRLAAAGTSAGEQPAT